MWVTAHKSVQAVWPWGRGKCVLYIYNKSLWPLKCSGHYLWYIKPCESHRQSQNRCVLNLGFFDLSSFFLWTWIHTPVKTSKYNFVSFDDRNWSLADGGYRGLQSEMTISQTVKWILLRCSKGSRHQQVWEDPHRHSHPPPRHTTQSAADELFDTSASKRICAGTTNSSLHWLKTPARSAGPVFQWLGLEEVCQESRNYLFFFTFLH